MPFDSFTRMRPETARLMAMMDDGLVDARAVADMALMWLSERSVADMMLANDLLVDEDDGQPDEAQEWESFDPDC